jgi:hypothetical protein
MRIVHIVLAASTFVTAGLGFSAARGDQSPNSATAVVVYKSPTCGCCSAWAEHVRAAGFRVEVQSVSDDKLRSISRDGGVTNDLASCHTAKVGGYTVEGHVPAADIQRLLKEKPSVAGIAVPGMPMGSPGMEQGGRKDPFNTIAFTKDGNKTVFAKH